VRAVALEHCVSCAAPVLIPDGARQVVMTFDVDDQVMLADGVVVHRCFAGHARMLSLARAAISRDQDAEAEPRTATRADGYTA